jgi:Protein-L-isoaspartate carboxylmethyltransferase
VTEPSPWVARWAGHIPAGGRALDLACGSGRHAAYLASLGHPVEAVDIDLSQLTEEFRCLPGVTLRQADLENAPWPYRTAEFAGIVVTRYLHRPLFPFLLDALGPGGVLIYETFAAGNERFGRPRNPDFLLQPGELLEAVRGRLRVVAFEEGLGEGPAAVQRICAVDPARELLLLE